MPKHHIVALDNWPRLPPVGFDHDYTHYASTTAEELPDRIKDATIILTTVAPVTRAGIRNAPNLQLVACSGTGSNQVDKAAMREHGIAVCNVPAQNTESVSEHAFALYYAIRREIPRLHDIVMRDEIWKRDHILQAQYRSPPRVNSQEKLVVVGYGALGRCVEKMATALGMTVLIAERKGASTVRDGRIGFEDALKQGTVFMLMVPLDDDSRNMFATPEFEAMDRTALIVNVGRGGIINEADLAQALRDGTIGGAATDVFEHEPATKSNCPLLDPSIPNLVLSPHLACLSFLRPKYCD